MTTSPAFREPRVLRWLGLALLAAGLVSGAWLRWSIRAPAISSDEIALVNPPGRGHIDFFANIEWARNAPLFPFLFSLIPDLRVALQAGRDVATICGLAAVIAVFVAARRATEGDSISGALAAAFVALNPVLAYESVTFRPYGIWALVESWRLACLSALLAERSDAVPRGPWKTFVALTCLMPWTHYASFAILTAEALLLGILLPGKRHLLRAHVIAAVTALPLIAFVIYMRNSPEAAGSAIHRTVEIAFAQRFGNRWGLAVAVFALAIAVGSRPVERGVLVNWVAVAIGALALSAVTLVRPAVVVVGVPAFAVAAPTVARVLSGRARYIGVVVAAYLMLVPSPLASNQRRDYGAARESADIAAFAAEMRRGQVTGTWNVFPDWNVTVLDFHLDTNGMHPEVRGPDLIQAGPTTLRPFRDLGKPPTGQVVVFSCDDRLVGCTPTGGRPCAKTYECP